jgi:hypothetical protein
MEVGSPLLVYNRILPSGSFVKLELQSWTIEIRVDSPVAGPGRINSEST